MITWITKKIKADILKILGNEYKCVVNKPIESIDTETLLFESKETSITVRGFDPDEKCVDPSKHVIHFVELVGDSQEIDDYFMLQNIIVVPDIYMYYKRPHNEL